MENTEQATLHDTVTAQFDAIIPDAENPPASTPEAVPLPETAEAPKPLEVGDERPRGPDGKFIPKEPAAAQPKTATPTTQAVPPAPALAAEPAKLQRPSSWKKEHWEAFDKLATENPTVAQYILQRETEAARGVSAYKAEWDRAKPLVQAFEPYREDFQKWGLDPAAQFSRYIEIHKGLALGNEDQRLGMLLGLARDYKIPIEKMFVQQNGQVYFNPQVQPATVQPQTQQLNPQNLEATVQAVIAKERLAADINSMASDAVKYPHFETVRDTMAQLLDAGIATDLPGAYEAALALPQHRELAAEQQKQQAAADEAARKAKLAAETQRARAAAVSPRSATPASGPAKASKGLRDTIAEQVEALGSSRV